MDVSVSAVHWPRGTSVASVLLFLLVVVVTLLILVQYGQFNVVSVKQSDSPPL